MKLNASFAVNATFTVIGFVVFLFTFAMSFVANAINGIGDRNVTASSNTALFSRDTESLSTKYPSLFSPAAWIFVIIWPVIFLWNTVGFTYTVASLCLPPPKSVIKNDPPLVTTGYLICAILGWGLTCAWLFVWDRDQPIAALVVLILSCYSSYGMLGFLYYAAAKNVSVMEKNNKVMLILTRILIHNGLGVYCTWLSCAWLLNLQTVFTYDTIGSQGIPDGQMAQMNGNVTLDEASVIILSILLVKFLVWFVLENFVFEKYCRYTLTIYPTLIFVLIGSYTRLGVELGDSSPTNRNQILNIVLLALVSLAFIVRVPLVIIRHNRRDTYA